MKQSIAAQTNLSHARGDWGAVSWPDERASRSDLNAMPKLPHSAKAPCDVDIHFWTDIIEAFMTGGKMGNSQSGHLLEAKLTGHETTS